jgi:hypothetical protein
MEVRFEITPVMPFLIDHSVMRLFLDEIKILECHSLMGSARMILILNF